MTRSYCSPRQDAKEEFESSYEVADHLYAKAKITDPTHVSLFLGVRWARTVGAERAVSHMQSNDIPQANTMVEYTLEEAIELLEKNLKNADANMLSVNSDLQFLREQITTTEVSILAPRCGPIHCAWPGLVSFALRLVLCLQFCPLHGS